MAAAGDLNDEFTLILNQAVVAAELVGPGHPARADLIELQHATLRCAAIARQLLIATLRLRPAAAVKRYSGNRHAHSGD